MFDNLINKGSKTVLTKYKLKDKESPTKYL